MDKISTRIREEISNSGIMIMRDRNTDKPLGIAWNERGFSLLANKTGRIPYFKNARITVN